MRGGRFAFVIPDEREKADRDNQEDESVFEFHAIEGAGWKSTAAFPPEAEAKHGDRGGNKHHRE